MKKLIGGGGFGQVHEATWRGTPVAMKVLAASSQAENVQKAILQKFAAEINMVSGMRHPNICLYIGACLEHPNRCIVTGMYYITLFPISKQLSLTFLPSRTRCEWIPVSPTFSGIGVGMQNMSRLEYYGWTVKSLKHPIWNPNYDDLNDFDWDRQLQVIDFNELWIWTLVEYDKVVFLADSLIILKDITDLFDADIWTESADRQFAAASKALPSDQFNAHVLLIKPDRSIFTEMLHDIKTGNIDSSVGDVEDFLNNFFPDWYEMPSPHRLRPIYNIPFLWTEDEHAWTTYRSEIRVFDFGDSKPWYIVADPSNHRVSKFAAPLVYVWSLFRFFVSLPTGNPLEEEARYVFREVFDITKSSKAVIEYIERMKRGGTRRRVEL